MAEFRIDTGGTIYTGALYYSSQSLARGLFRATEPPTGLLMPAVRWMSRNGHHILVERPPQTVLIQFSPGAKGEILRWSPEDKEQRAKSYALPLPWTVWLFTDIAAEKPGMFVWGRPRPITSLDDEIYILPTPNQALHGYVCVGSENAFAGNHSLQAKIAFYMNAFWTDGFNLDMGEPMYLPKHMSHMKKWDEWLTYWQSQSVEDVLEWEFSPGGIRTLFGGYIDENKLRPATVGEIMNKYNSLGHIEKGGSIDFLRKMCQNNG